MTLMNPLIVLLSALWSVAASDTGTLTHVWDDRGYLIFCLCMGRFGNQVDQFLGGLAFARSIDRTLILPPWRTYKNLKFTDWFKLEPLEQYHRMIVAEDFMSELAPGHWPSGNRTGFCYSFKEEDVCELKKGNPFGPFWDGLGIDFDVTKTYQLSYESPDQWKIQLSANKYPVLALKGAPASFPIKEKHVDLQRYLQWSDSLMEEAMFYVHEHFNGEKYIGLHLRNGPDWENACNHAEGLPKYMSSPQCLGYGTQAKVTKKLCLPPGEEILRLTKNIVLKTRIKYVYVATDKYPLIQELSEHLKAQKVKVYHQDPHLPQIDLIILGQSDYFIGNCVSSFTAFVTRERAVNEKPTSFWGYS